MSNVERLKSVCLMEANGDRDLAFTIACRKAVQWYLATSPGFVREAPAGPWAIAPKPRVEPVLIEGEG